VSVQHKAVLCSTIVNAALAQPATQPRSHTATQLAPAGFGWLRLAAAGMRPTETRLTKGCKWLLPTCSRRCQLGRPGTPCPPRSCSSPWHMGCTRCWRCLWSRTQRGS